MYTSRTIKWSIILRFAWRNILFFLLYSGIITFFYVAFHLDFIAMPFLPISLIGTAVAFYVGFKNNSSYTRLWEARKIWGAIVNVSRTFGSYVKSYVSSDSPEHDERVNCYHKLLIYRHLAFINALRIRLRSRSTWEQSNDPSVQIVEQHSVFYRETMKEGLSRFLSPDEVQELEPFANQATQILHLQSMTLHAIRREGLIDRYQHIELGRMIAELYNQQGACERIKTFPFPRQYAYFSKVFVWLFILVLPFGLITEFAKLGEHYVWLTILFHVVVSWVFSTMEIVGDTSENPFENGINDIPMTAICRTIEIDLKEMLRETNIPKPVTPVNNILM